MARPTAMAAPHPIEAGKSALRTRIRASCRARSFEDEVAIREAVLMFAVAAGATSIAAFIPFDDEPDLRPAFSRIESGNARVLLPVIVERDAPLRFRPWAAGRAIVAGPLGTRHPADGPEEDPDLVLVPLLAFDRAGHRLGRGGGFYDRTLAALPRARAVGVAWSDRQVETVPSGPFDVTLDAVVTEVGVIAVTGRS